MNFRKQDPSLNEQAHVADNTENKVENTVKHQVTKKKCPKIYRVIFFWIATIISISFLIAAIQAGMIQVVVIAIVWSVSLFILRNFAYKDLYSRMSMLSVVIATIAISYVAVSFKTDESTPMSQESNQIEETEKVAEVEIKDEEETIENHEFSKEESITLLQKLKTENRTIVFEKIEDQPYAEWHGEDGKVLFRGGESIKAENVSEQQLHEIEQLLSQEGLKPNKYNEGSMVGGVGFKGFETEKIGCIISTEHYADESKSSTDVNITCWDLG